MALSIGKHSYRDKENLPTLIGQNQGMPTSRLNPRQSLARNVQLLMDLHKWNQVDLAKRAGIDQKTISNIINQKNTPTLDKLAAIADAFGLNAWHLILPDLPSELVNGGTIEKLFRNYLSASAKGREYIDHVAEREASYIPDKDAS